MKEITFGSVRIRGTQEEIKMTFFLNHVTAVLPAGNTSEDTSHSLVRLSCGLEIIIGVNNEEVLKAFESVY